MSLVGRRRGPIEWTYDDLTPTLAKLTVAIEANVKLIMHQQAKRVQTYMRANAPWEDRTGDARSGLFCTPEEDVDAFNLYLFHTVDYGIWLEVRWGGYYAIIDPTIEVMGPEVMSALNGLLTRSAITARIL